MRLPHQDCSDAGAYFVTICAAGRACLFGNVLEGTMLLTDFGRDVELVWSALPDHYPSVLLDQFVIMPNHVHGILVLSEGSRQLGEIVRGFKTFSAHRVNSRRGTLGASLWQRGFYDHIVRDDRDLDRIREYIETNPARWALDEENPARVSPVRP